MRTHVHTHTHVHVYTCTHVHVCVHRCLVQGLTVPVFCKIRLLDDMDDAIQFCKPLESAGCALIAVHARYMHTYT